MAGKIGKLASLAMAFMLVCLLAEGLLPYVVTPHMVLANPATERQSPDAILAITNLSPNDYTYIQDDPDSPDTNWLVASGNSVNIDVRVSFPTPTGNPTVGTDLQEFRVQVRQFDTGQTGTPDARIELWENGSLIRAGSYVPVTGSGQVISFAWNANEIGTADGSLVEFMVVGKKSGGGPTARNTVEVGAVEWNVDYTAAGIEKSVIQTITIADGVTAALTAWGNISQGITVSDGVTAALAAGRNISQGITISDGVTAALAAGRNISQGITISDGVTAAVGRGRNISQTLSITAITSTEASFSRSVSQGITLSDGVTIAVGRGRNVSQGITISDGVTATQGICPVCSTKMFRIGKS